jgi:hypothetical protein
VYATFGDNISKSSPSLYSATTKSTGQVDPDNKEAYSWLKQEAITISSKDATSPIKEKPAKDQDFDEEPLSSLDAESDAADSDNLPSLVQPKKLYQTQESKTLKPCHSVDD